MSFDKAQGKPAPAFGRQATTAGTKAMSAEQEIAEGGGDVEIGLRGMRGAPGRVETRLGSAFDPKEIDSPGNCGIKRRSEGAHGNGELSGPDFLADSKAHAALHAAPGVEFFTRANVDINPETVGTDLKLEIAAGFGGIRLEEDFSNVAIPELPAAAGGLGVRENSDGLKIAAKAKKKSFGSPEEANFGLEPGIGVLPLPVPIKSDWRRGLPGGGGGKTVSV